MQAIQFKTIVHNEGTIKIPECYRTILQGKIQLIVLFQDNLKKIALQAVSQIATFSLFPRSGVGTRNLHNNFMSYIIITY